MRMLGYFMVNFIHTLLNVSEDKVVILNDFPQNLLELGGFCQRIEFCLDTPLVRDHLFRDSMIGETFYDLRSQTYGHGLKGLYQHTESTAYVKLFSMREILSCG